MNWQKLHVDWSENENLGLVLREISHSRGLSPESPLLHVKIQEEPHSRSDFGKYGQFSPQQRPAVGVWCRLFAAGGWAFLPLQPQILKGENISKTFVKVIV